MCIEAHANAYCHSDDQVNKYHFHMAVKLDKRGRCLQVKKYLNDKFGIQVHFSDHHNSYYSAYKYVTKKDSEAVHSSGHPDLTTAPKTEAAIVCKKRKDKKDSRATTKERKEERLTVYDVCKIIQEKGITTSNCSRARRKEVFGGNVVHLPASKTFCKRDLELTPDTPFFATADAPLVLIRKATIDRTNTEMMNVRWRYFHFWKKFLKPNRSTSLHEDAVLPDLF